jgi:hypothetical protein
MSKESECGESLRVHTCHGPLHRVKDDGIYRTLCMSAITRLMRNGHDMEIKEVVPRKFKKETPEHLIIEQL